MLEITNDGFSLNAFSSWLDTQSTIPKADYDQYVQTLIGYKQDSLLIKLLPKGRVSGLYASRISLRMPNVIPDYSKATEDSKYICIYNRELLELITKPDEWQRINFASVKVHRNTLAPITMVQNPEHIEVSRIILRAVKRQQRKQPHNKNKLLISYLTKQINHWTKES